VILAAVATLIAPGCSGDANGGGQESTVVTTGATPDPSTSVSPSSPSTTEAATTTSSTSTTSTTLPAPEFPPGREELTHGGDTWAVVLAASEVANDPLLVTAESDAEQAGYLTGATDCDVGAAAALGLPDENHYYTVSVYLNNEEDADAAVEGFASLGVEGVAAVIQTFCLD
jgi:hypothetical protein